MAVGKGSILRAGNANAAAKEKKAVKENKPSVESTEAVLKETGIAVKATDMAAKVPLEALKSVPKAWGSNRLDAARVDALAESLLKYGMLLPVLIYKNQKQELLVIKGSHRIAAAKQTGMTEVPAVFLETDSDRVAKEVYMELRSFDRTKDKEYEVVSSITVNMPSYLL